MPAEDSARQRRRKTRFRGPIRYPEVVLWRCTTRHPSSPRFDLFLADVFDHPVDGDGDDGVDRPKPLGLCRVFDG